MTPFLLDGFAIIAYLASTLAIAKGLSAGKSSTFTAFPLIYAWIAVILHGVITYQTLITPNGVNLNFYSSTSFISAIVVLLFLIAAVSKPIDKLGLAIFPLAALMLGLGAAIPGKVHILSNTTWQMDLHILSSIVAFSLLNIAAFQAVLLAMQDHQLRSHHPHPLIRTLPALQTMESLLFQMIWAGLFFLSISLLTGFIFIEDLFAQHLAHKTVLSIFAWFVFSILLGGRIRYGWRGQTAIRWTISGFVLLLLAYFGSKLVLELILERV